MRDEFSTNSQQEDVLFVTCSNPRQNRQGPRNTVNLLNTTNSRNNGIFRSQCNDVELSRNGELTVVYNTSALSVFTIFIINNNSKNITAFLQVSPDAKHFRTEPGSLITIEPDQMDIFSGKAFSKFTSVVLNGPAYAHVQMFIQGQIA